MRKVNKENFTNEVIDMGARLCRCIVCNTLTCFKEHQEGCPVADKHAGEYLYVATGGHLNWLVFHATYDEKMACFATGDMSGYQEYVERGHD